MLAPLDGIEDYFIVRNVPNPSAKSLLPGGFSCECRDEGPDPLLWQLIHRSCGLARVTADRSCSVSMGRKAYP